MMNPEWKRKWVTALRSGKYQQGIDRLRRTFGDNDQFCVLGVACDLVDPTAWVPPGTKENPMANSWIHGSDSNSCMPDPKGP